MSSPAPDEAFARELAIRCHAEGVTCLAVAAVIEDNHDRVLLIATPGEEFTDVWELPTGEVFPGETVLDALYRVVTLTTGLTVDNVTGYVGHYDQDHPDNDGTLRVLVFNLTPLDPGLICRAATIGHQWVHPHQLADIDPFLSCRPLD